MDSASTFTFRGVTKSGLLICHQFGMTFLARCAFRNSCPDDERQETAAGFWGRAREFLAEHGITIKRVLTDNGSCYRSRPFAQALGPDVRHRKTRPYRPQTNGKVERFNRTLNQEWAYAQTYLTDEAPAQRPTRPGCTTTITTDATPASAESHPSNASAFTTSLRRTARACLPYGGSR